VRDQLFVQASPDVGEIDCLHGQQPLSDVNPSPGRR
jgi:hypothetical protein